MRTRIDEPAAAPSHVPLPRGRILYRSADESPFVVLIHERTRGLYLSPEGWNNDVLVAGPFAEDEALRAWRLANVRVPDGCERGPWQWGIHLFDLQPLPFPADEWSTFEPSWLPPGAQLYSDADADRVVNEACCGTPHDEPHVRWGEPGAPIEDLLAVVRRRYADPVIGAAGQLGREWNAHPTGSPVLRIQPSGGTERFVVVDLPPAE